MTRDELDNLALFLRTHLNAAGRVPDPSAPVDTAGAGAHGSSGLSRSVEQAVLGIEAYLQLADHHPEPRGLAAERQRAEALWERLQEIAAQWPNPPCPQSAPSARAQAGAPLDAVRVPSGV